MQATNILKSVFCLLLKHTCTTFAFFFLVHRTWVPCFDSSFIKEDNFLCSREPCLQYIVESLPYYIIISKPFIDITFNKRIWKIHLAQTWSCKFFGLEYPIMKCSFLDLLTNYLHRYQVMLCQPSCHRYLLDA